MECIVCFVVWVSLCHTPLSFVPCESSRSTQDVYDIANTLNFIVIYDNINRTVTRIQPSHPDRSKLLSGTASTLYLIEEGDLAVVNPAVIRSARQTRSREGMSPQYLLEGH